MWGSVCDKLLLWGVWMEKGCRTVTDPPAGLVLSSAPHRTWCRFWGPVWVCAAPAANSCWHQHICRSASGFPGFSLQRKHGLEEAGGWLERKSTSNPTIPSDLKLLTRALRAAAEQWRRSPPRSAPCRERKPQSSNEAKNISVPTESGKPAFNSVRTNLLGGRVHLDCRVSPPAGRWGFRQILSELSDPLKPL